MAENRPYRPFADIQEMQRTFFVQAGVRGIRVLQDFVAKNNFSARSVNQWRTFRVGEIRNHSPAEAAILLMLSLAWWDSERNNWQGNIAKAISLFQSQSYFPRKRASGACR